MTKRILSLIVVFVSLFVIIALNCSGEATYDDGGGGGSDTATTTTTVGISDLAAPTGLTTSSITSESITVSWNAVTGAVSYNIYRSTDAESYTKVGASDSVSFTDAGLAADTMYFYKIKSVDNKARESEFSAPTFAKTSTSTTIPTKSVVFNLVITLDQSIDQVKGKTFDDIGSIKLTSGTGVFDGETNNVSDYFKIYQKTAGGPITFNVSGDVCEAQISAQTPYDGARWVYFEAYYTDGKTTLSEQKYPDNFTINSDTTTLTADTTLDSVYGDIGINLETNN